MEQSFKEKAAITFQKIKDSKNILLHLHPRPDGDSVGSALAIMHVLSGLGKNVTVIKGDSPLPLYLSRLPGFDRIIEKNFFEVDLSEFDLFIAQDISSVGMISGLGEVVFPPSLAVLRIDHHQTTAHFAHINVVYPEYPATAELLFDLFKEWDIKLTHDIALCSYIGIYSDTGGFKYKSVRKNTFLAISELITFVPNIAEDIAFLEEHTTLENIKYEALGLSSIQSLIDGKILMSSVSFYQLSSHKIPAADTILPSGFSVASQLKSVVGCEIGISFVEEEPNFVKVSMRKRTGSEYDLAKIAEKVGGGGHAAAAGVVFKGTLKQAEEAILNSFKEPYLQS